MELYCKVYVVAPGLDELRDRVAAAVGGEVTIRTVEGDELLVDVLRNDEYDEARAAGGEGDFLYFPFLLEVEPSDDADLDGFVRAVASLLDTLRATGYDFVTSADFEEMLPGRGRTERPTP
ncbi:MAG TPA: hypothetical protein VFZ77_18735 [Acidimicrobiales bacterium]